LRFSKKWNYRNWSLDLQHRVDLQANIKISEEYTASIYFSLEDGGSMFLRNVGIYLHLDIVTALQYAINTNLHIINN
jgi:hypothetical protein